MRARIFRPAASTCEPALEFLQKQFLFLDKVQLDELHRRGDIARGDGVEQRVIAFLVVLDAARRQVAAAQLGAETLTVGLDREAIA